MKNHKLIYLTIIIILLSASFCWSQTKSSPGLFENYWPPFSVSYPSNWEEVVPVDQYSVFRANSPDGSSSFWFFVISKMNIPIKDSANIFRKGLKQAGAEDIKLIHEKKIQLNDGTPAYETEFECTLQMNQIKQNNFYLTIKERDTWIAVAIISTNGRINEDLKKIAYTLRKRAKEKNEVRYKYKVPEQTDDGWETCHVAKVNIDEHKLSDLIKKIQNGTYINIHSVLIIKNGKLVFEEYFPGKDVYSKYTSYTRDDLHFLASVTKSFSSTLTGIAIDKGVINGTDENLGNFFPEYKNELSADNKAKIKLHHVLSMSAGFDWDEQVYSPNDPRNVMRKMFNSKDIIGFILNRPIKDKPGSKFMYNSGLSMLLGTIVEKRSSLKLTEFAEKNLFNPLGISRYAWTYIGKVPESAGGLSLRPRDMAKLGYLFFKKGKWNGKQIVPEKWVKDATSQYVTPPRTGTGYGYQWWLIKWEIDNTTIEGYFAAGWGGQRIFVFPALDAVVVLTAGNHYYNDDLIASTILKNSILPALIRSY